MSKPKRLSLADRLGREDDVTSSRDDVITSTLEEPPASPPAKAGSEPPSKAPTKAPKAGPVAAPEAPKELRRKTYHASLYLPEEAQFALREIALTMRRAKPHDVMLEAMAELFEKYNKGALARECRSRITQKR